MNSSTAYEMKNRSLFRRGKYKYINVHFSTANACIFVFTDLSLSMDNTGAILRSLSFRNCSAFSQ